jgi:glycosyltransferase involved in cell wall biosynthesis
VLPRITVVTPSLNQAAFLERSIRSVLDQGYENLEYLVVDGGSTDGSTEILERYSGRITRWVSEADSGQSDAINKALGWATGDIVGYINSDDFYLPGALATVGRTMRSASVRWCVGRCRYERDDGSLEQVYVPQEPRMPRLTMIRETWYVPQASSFWRRDVFEEVGPLRADLHYIFDLEFGLRCALNGVRPTCVDDELAVRFLHDDAKSAAPERFEAEYVEVRAELEGRYARRGDGVRDVLYRARRRALRVSRELLGRGSAENGRG